MKLLTLPAQERRELIVLARTVKDVKTALRIRIILALDAGYSEKEVAEILLVDADTVRRCKKKYEKRQFFTDWLADTYKGYGGKLTKEAEMEIDAYVQTETINAEETMKLFDKIQAAYPDKRTIYLIVDNARYYKNVAVQAYLADPNCRIKLKFLPTYSPNLNFIERLWKFMKKYIIGVKYREKFKEFENDVMQFFEDFPQYETKLRQFIGTELHLVKLTV